MHYNGYWAFPLHLDRRSVHLNLEPVDEQAPLPVKARVA